MTLVLARKLDTCGTKPAFDLFVLIDGDIWLTADDEVALLYCPLMPALESNLQAIAERTRNSFGSSAASIAL